jgi:hypothetical protein
MIGSANMDLVLRVPRFPVAGATFSLRGAWGAMHVGSG